MTWSTSPWPDSQSEPLTTRRLLNRVTCKKVAIVPPRRSRSPASEGVKDAFAPA